MNLSGFYHRFPGVDGNRLDFPHRRGLQAAEIGCFTSHYLVYAANLDSPVHLHVVEDDTIFSARWTRCAIEALVSGRQFDDYDVIFTDRVVQLHSLEPLKARYDKLAPKSEGGKHVIFDVDDVKNTGFATASSYVVNKRAIRKLHDLCHDELSAGARAPIDLFLRKMADDGMLKIGCIFPFVTSIKLDRVARSTIPDRYANMLTPLAFAIARQMFFVDCDFEECWKYTRRLLQTRQFDDRSRLIAEILEFCRSDTFEKV
jgi:GR25 family glycosyltransferase involved in LPS biosynthesis